MCTQIDNKEALSVSIEYLTQEQALFISNFIELFINGGFNKGDLMELCDMHGTGKVDSALPIDYVRRIQEIYPGFRTAFHVYDYREQTYGAVTNIAESVILKASELFNK